MSIARLVLLSQPINNPLGMAKATQNVHETLDVVDHFKKPVSGWAENLMDNISRTEGIRAELASLDTLRLSPATPAKRDEAIILCDSLVRAYSKYLSSVDDDKAHYNNFINRRNSLDSLNNVVMEKLQRSIFINGNTSLARIFEPGFGNFQPQQEIATEVTRDEIDSEWKSTPETVREINQLTFFSSILISLLLLFSLNKLKGKLPRKLAWAYRYRGAVAFTTFFALRMAVDFFMIPFADMPNHVRSDIFFNMQFDLLGILIAIDYILDKTASKLRYVTLVYLPLILTADCILAFISQMIVIDIIMLMMTIILFVGLVLQFVFNIVFRKNYVKATESTLGLTSLFSSLL